VAPGAAVGTVQQHITPIWSCPSIFPGVTQPHDAADVTPSEVRLNLEEPLPDLPPLVTDPKLLRVVLSNLVSNALKFTRRHDLDPPEQRRPESCVRGSRYGHPRNPARPARAGGLPGQHGAQWFRRPATAAASDALPDPARPDDAGGERLGVPEEAASRTPSHSFSPALLSCRGALLGAVAGARR
jgi:hypothetical protein